MNQSLNSLQLIRAIAALGVVVFHAHVYFIAIKLYPNEPISSFFNMGFAGVELFFVLSGFIMVFIHWKDMGRRDKFLIFFLKRITRIIPLYWFFLVFLMAIYFSIPQLSPENLQNIVYVLKSFFLIPNDKGFILEVAWTLTYEFVFYAFFSFLIIHKRWGMAVFLGWQLAVLINVFLGFSELLVFSAYNLLFFFGGLSALTYKYVSFFVSVVFLLIGGTGFSIVGYLGVGGYWEGVTAYRTLAYGVFAALLMSGIVRLEDLGKLHIHTIFKVLGDASYSIYLSHGFSLSVASFIFSYLGLLAVLPKGVIFLLLVSSGVIGGLFLYYIVERRLIGWSKYFITSRYP
ncbi:acyltransferase [Neptuniibacter pectenicola]|uniref:Acyltransferase n=1 Tax=Neptuniibacter pectenicola TaxID=1806669 RepID=A0ABU9TNW7_9GAMM